jgi:hypothetical protein
MFFSRTMAGFTPPLIRGNLGVKYILPMRVIPFETLIKVRMAFFASFGSYIPFLLGLHLLLAEGTKTDEGYRNG